MGPGGSPDENGETTLDALIMNGVIKFLPLCFFKPHRVCIVMLRQQIFNLFQIAVLKNMPYYVNFCF